MSLSAQPQKTKYLITAAGILGLVFRAVLYTDGMDRKGLLTTGHWASTGIWLLTAGAALVILLLSRGLTGPENGRCDPPCSISGAAAAILAGIAFALSPVPYLPSKAFAAIEPVLRLAAAASLIAVSYCRFRGKPPHLLFHCAVCLYLALRLVCQYRVWSADPQIQNYAFYMGAHVALMLTAYQFAALDGGFGNFSTLWSFGLASIYLSTAAVVHSQDPFFLLSCTLWIWTSLPLPSAANAPQIQPTQEESQ